MAARFDLHIAPRPGGSTGGAQRASLARGVYYTHILRPLENEDHGVVLQKAADTPFRAHLAASENPEFDQGTTT